MKKRKISKAEKTFYAIALGFIVIGLVYLRVLDTLWMRPLTALTEWLVLTVLSPLSLL